MLEAQITVTIANAPVTYAFGKEGGACIHKTTDVGGDALIRRCTDTAPNIRFHLREVLFPVAANNIQTAKAGYMLISARILVKCGDHAGNFSQESRGSASGMNMSL